MRLTTLLTLLFVLVFAILHLGCVDDSDLDSARRSGSEAPPVSEIDTEGRISYSPPSSLPDSDKMDLPRGVNTPGIKRCRVSDHTYTVPPQTVEREIVTWVKQQVDFEATEPAQDWMVEADHLHLTSLRLEVKDGASLDFIEWLRIYIVGPDGDLHEVAWVALPGPSREVELEVQGSLDLRPYMTERDVNLEARVYASSPDTDTDLGATLTFRSFDDCVTND